VVAFTLQISAGKICEETVVYAHDRRTKKTRVVSKNSSGVTAEGCSDAGSLSGNGRYVAFHANAGNLPGGGMPGTHSYVHDRKTATTRLVTRTSSGTIVIGAFPVLSSSGAWVAFGSNDPALPGAAAAFQVYARGPL
jgi:Tol biopolymer transport system component